MRANLHLHSRFSDGTDWPEDAASRAAAAGLAHVALTDHDSLGGTTEFADACRAFGLKTTAATEIDCREPSIDYKSELLAYFPSGRYGRTASFLEGVCAERLRSTRASIKRAARHFPTVRLSFDELLERKRGNRHEFPAERFSFNKVDVYLYLRDAGAVPLDVDYKSFKKAYFDSRLLGSVKLGKPTCEEAARVVLSDGGLLVVPHLGHEFGDDAVRLERELPRLRRMLDYFARIGVSGVELYWYRNRDTEAINRIIGKEASEAGFFLSYGSDCHGPGSGKETIALFSGDFPGFPVV